MLISFLFNRYLLSPLTRLTHLHLNQNQITSIQQSAFAGIRMVEFINLQDNFIKFRDGDYLQSSPFQTLKALETLNLGNNSITEIFEDFTLESLQYLNLSSNLISSLSSDDLNNLQAKTIDVTYNQIYEINFDFDINQTVHVFVDHNPITCDCRLHKFVKHLENKNGKDALQKITIGGLTCAKPESMAGTKVREIDPFKLLCPLDNKETQIKRCPEGCECEIRPEDSHVLIVCDSSVDLSKLPAAHQNATKLTVFNINSNTSDLVLPTTSSQGFELVTYLNVSGNMLKQIQLENLPPRLVELDISNNSLETLNDTVMTFIEASKMKVHLGGNPWRCDCNEKDFIRVVKSLMRDDRVKNQDDLKCADGRYFREISQEILCSPGRDKSIMILSIITAIMGLGIGILAALYYKYQKQIKMWLYSHNMLLWFVTEEELDKVCTHQT